MIDDRLPGLLVEAGIASQEQADKLADLIRQLDVEDYPDIARGFIS